MESSKSCSMKNKAISQAGDQEKSGVYNSREKPLACHDIDDRVWFLFALETQVTSFLLDTIHHHINFFLDLLLEKLLCFFWINFCCSPHRICPSACHDHRLHVLFLLVVVSSRMLIVNVFDSNHDGHRHS